MQVDPVARARAIVADCMARDAEQTTRQPATATPRPRSPAGPAALGGRQVAFGFACILFSVCIIVYTLIPQ